MDFVVIGLGLSALALLTGLTLLCLVAPHWSRKAGVAQPGDAAYARAQAGERHALGQGFLCVGAVLLLTTLGGISAGLADKTGAYLIATVTTVAVLSLFGWDLLYRRQHPIPQRRRAAPARAQRAAEHTAGTHPAGPTAQHVANGRRRVLPARPRGSQAAPPATAAAEPALLTAGDGHAPGVIEPPADMLEPAPDIADPETQSSSEAEPAPPAEAPEPDSGATGDATASPPTESVSEATAGGEPVPDAAAVPEPAALAPATSNGTGDQAASPAPEPEPGPGPDMVPHGDDRVIALFPTAAARRGRTVVAPMDPDDQS